MFLSWQAVATYLPVRSISMSYSVVRLTMCRFSTKWKSGSYRMIHTDLIIKCSTSDRSHN